MKAIRGFALAAAAAACMCAQAGEEKVRLKEGSGIDKVRQNCVACHSLDYIPLNSPFLDQKGWEATVTKMNKAYGAPIKAEDAPVIAEYLAKNYGKK
jgi:mono/diheme cytochrome c family protein